MVSEIIISRIDHKMLQKLMTELTQKSNDEEYSQMQMSPMQLNVQLDWIYTQLEVIIIRLSLAKDLLTHFPSQTHNNLLLRVGLHPLVPFCIQIDGLSHIIRGCPITYAGAAFSKHIITRQSYYNLRNFLWCTAVSRQIYDGANFKKYISVNIKTSKASFIYVILRTHRQLYNAWLLDES